MHNKSTTNMSSKFYGLLCQMNHFLSKPIFMLYMKNKYADQPAHHSGPQIRVCNQKMIILFFSQNICCGTNVGNTQKNTKQMLKLMDKKMFTNLHSNFLLILICVIAG